LTSKAARIAHEATEFFVSYAHTRGHGGLVIPTMPSAM
jgi:hypothetical protein